MKSESGASKRQIGATEPKTSPPGTTITFSRVYKDGDQWKSTQSFGRNDLLVLAKVADFAHTRHLRAQLPQRRPFAPKQELQGLEDVGL